MDSRSEFEKLVDLKLVERLTRLNNNISDLINYVSQGDYKSCYETYVKIVEHNDFESVHILINSMEELKRCLTFNFK